MNAQQIISVFSGFIGLVLVIYFNEKQINTGINIMDLYFGFIGIMSFFTLLGFKMAPNKEYIDKFKASVSVLEFIPRIGIFTYFMYIWNIPMFIITLLHFMFLWKLFETFIWGEYIEIKEVEVK